MSRIVPPEPPLFAGASYELELVTVDRFGNDCTKGGAWILGKLQGSNMPSGQDPNVEVVDQKNGRYTFKLWLKAPADIKLYISVVKQSADTTAAGDTSKTVSEFAPVPLSFTSLKALRAKQERDTRRAEKAAAAGGASGALAIGPDASLNASGSIGASHSQGASTPLAGGSMNNPHSSMGAQSANRSLGMQSMASSGALSGSDSIGHESHRSGEKLTAAKNPLGMPAKASTRGKLRGAGAEFMAEVYIPKAAAASGKGPFGGPVGVIEAAVDGLRKDAARARARRGSRDP